MPEGLNGTFLNSATLPVERARDRLTLLELDLAELSGEEGRLSHPIDTLPPFFRNGEISRPFEPNPHAMAAKASGTRAVAHFEELSRSTGANRFENDLIALASIRLAGGAVETDRGPIVYLSRVPDRIRFAPRARFMQAINLKENVNRVEATALDRVRQTADRDRIERLDPYHFYYLKTIKQLCEELENPVRISPAPSERVSREEM